MVEDGIVFHYLKKNCVPSYLLEVIRVWVEEITAITTIPALVNTVKQRKQFTPNLLAEHTEAL